MQQLFLHSTFAQSVALSKLFSIHLIHRPVPYREYLPRNDRNVHAFNPCIIGSTYYEFYLKLPKKRNLGHVRMPIQRVRLAVSIELQNCTLH
jgi:hypothetical protein